MSSVFNIDGFGEFRKYSTKQANLSLCTKLRINSSHPLHCMELRHRQCSSALTHNVSNVSVQRMLGILWHSFSNAPVNARTMLLEISAVTSDNRLALFAHMRHYSHLT